MCCGWAHFFNAPVLDGSHYSSAFTFKSSSLAVGRRESADKREVLLIAGSTSYSTVGVISLLSKVNGRRPHFFIHRPQQLLARSNTNKSARNISIATVNSQRQVLKLVSINQPKVSCIIWKRSATNADGTVH